MRLLMVQHRHRICTGMLLHGRSLSLRLLSTDGTSGVVKTNAIIVATVVGVIIDTVVAEICSVGSSAVGQTRHPCTGRRIGGLINHRGGR